MEPSLQTNWRQYLEKRVLVIFFLGFSAGLPFALVYSTLTAWLETAAVDRSTISTFAWLGFAYSFKFVWAPIIDSTRVPLLSGLLGRRRSWMLLAQLSIGLALLVLSQVNPAQNIELFAIVAFAVAFSSATQDIVVDAYRIECAEVRMQGVLAAAYQYGYRVALIFSMGGALILSDYVSWSLTYQIMALMMIIGLVATLWADEPEEITERFRAPDGTLIDKAVAWFRHAVAEPFGDFIQRFGRFALVLIVFISLYRISDYVLGILANPFYLDLGYTGTQIGLIAKTYGAWVTIVGIGAGGWAVLKFGVARCLVTATVLIASTNLFFAAMVLVGPEPWMLAVTITADNVAQGFGGTVLIAYLSSLVNASFTATQYAMLSSIMSLFPKLVAGYAGNVQEAVGWLGFFLYAAALGIPAILLAGYVGARHERYVGNEDAK
jgi:PAT family beta-lactamase induction signal transducer AmpG